MKLLLDNCVPIRLIRQLPEFEVIYAGQCGFEQLSNGKLLAAAEGDGFDAVINVDKNFSFQQSSHGRNISLITLNSLFVGLDDLIPLLPKLKQILVDLPRGQFIQIDSKS